MCVCLWPLARVSSRYRNDLEVLCMPTRQLQVTVASLQRRVVTRTDIRREHALTARSTRSLRAQQHTDTESWSEVNRDSHETSGVGRAGVGGWTNRSGLPIQCTGLGLGGRGASSQTHPSSCPCTRRMERCVSRLCRVWDGQGVRCCTMQCTLFPWLAAAAPCVFLCLVHERHRSAGSP